ncbi:hypothetical protein [Haloechinothrix salitolerans]|uniref:Uncharacterized protein n=1 Tax=Haloechinothrix salitolerans TaxID=926830 RepID=A0ABW2C1B4_9PSEU
MTVPPLADADVKRAHRRSLVRPASAYAGRSARATRLALALGGVA